MDAAVIYAGFHVECKTFCASKSNFISTKPYTDNLARLHEIQLEFCMVLYAFIVLVYQ